MALTAEQRSSLYRYLGWSYYDGEAWRLEQRLDQLASRPGDEAIVVELLGKCDDTMTALADVPSRLKAMAVGTIRLAGPVEIGGLRTLGRQYAGQIADLLGVEKRRDAFGGSVGHTAGPLSGGGGTGHYVRHG